MSTRDLLIEIGCEDLPARFVQALAQALADGLEAGLRERQIEHGPTRVFATPRRIAAWIAAVAEQQPEQSLERRGPAVAAAFRDGQATPAATGFAQSCGVSVEQLQRLETPKGSWLLYQAVLPGAPTAELLDGVFANALQNMDKLVPKRMRWGAGDATFVRPVQWLLALFGKEVLPLRGFGLTAGRSSRGHRFHAPDAITISAADQYEAQLRAAHVWADFGGRRAEIARQIAALGRSLNGQARARADLLDEVTALVEWPQAIAGQIEARFLELPPEVVVVTIEDHQRYFPVFDAQGQLLPAFITVSNIESSDPGKVVHGNERVVRPRLADALFFWEQDRKHALAELLPRLQAVTYQQELGSVGARVERMAELARASAEQVSDVDPDQAARAARLCKADLVSQMVYEFPELQGIMGGYYARESGEHPAVAEAIAQHYAPKQSGDPIPASRLGQIVALTDKLDVLAGIFSIGMKPTGSKDPFALRRAAIGCLRILREGNLALPLADLLSLAIDRQPGENAGACHAELLAFMQDRLEALVVDEGVAVEWYRAVRASKPVSVAEFFSRLDALGQFLELPAAGVVASAHKRARNILRQAALQERPEIDPARFTDASEGQLMDQVLACETQVQTAMDGGDFGAGLTSLAAMAPALEAFFEAVMVMDENPAIRNNRLGLLARLDALCRRVADLSQLGS